MIGDALRIEIERFAMVRIRRNEMFRMAERGEVTRSCIRGYLENLHYLISQSPRCLRRAGERSRDTGLSAVAEFFEHKLEEEFGHEIWAERDIASMSDSSTMLISGVLPAMQDLVAYIDETIERDPALYLAYILFAEYFTVMIGPVWLQLLEERCGIPRTSMTVVDKHVDLDVEHAEHGFEQVDDLVGDPAMLSTMREVLLGSMDRFERFCTELASTHADHDERARTVSSPQVTAA